MPDITTAALAAQDGCASNTVTKWARLHGIKPIGRDYLFSKQQVAAFLARPRTPGRKPKPDAAKSRKEDQGND